MSDNIEIVHIPAANVYRVTWLAERLTVDVPCERVAPPRRVLTSHPSESWLEPTFHQRVLAAVPPCLCTSHFGMRQSGCPRRLLHSANTLSPQSDDKPDLSHQLHGDCGQYHAPGTDCPPPPEAPTNG